MGKVPTVRLLDGDILRDSGAILFNFSSGTALWPDLRRDQAEVLRWMFFEQSNFDLDARLAADFLDLVEKLA